MPRHLLRLPFLAAVVLLLGGFAIAMAINGRRLRDEERQWVSEQEAAVKLPTVTPSVLANIRTPAGAHPTSCGPQIVARCSKWPHPFLLYRRPEADVAAFRRLLGQLGLTPVQRDVACRAHLKDGGQVGIVSCHAVMLAGSDLLNISLINAREPASRRPPFGAYLEIDDGGRGFRSIPSWALYSVR